MMRWLWRGRGQRASVAARGPSCSEEVYGGDVAPEAPMGRPAILLVVHTSIGLGSLADCFVIAPPPPPSVPLATGPASLERCRFPAGQSDIGWLALLLSHVGHHRLSADRPPSPITSCVCVCVYQSSWPGIRSSVPPSWARRSLFA